MSVRRTPRRPGCESLESRTCPTAFVGPMPNVPVSAPFVGPLPTMPASEIPAPRTDAFALGLQSFFAQEEAAHTPSVLFLGDSITYNFGYASGTPVWQAKLAPLDTQDFGVPSDMTQNILWRIEHGELADHPAVISLMAGTNNLVFGHESAAETVDGITAIVKEIRLLSPQSKIILNGVLPYGLPGDPLRQEIQEVNASISRLADDMHVYFINPGPDMIAADGSIADDFLPDLLHPDEAGYVIWSDQIIGLIDQLLDLTPQPSPPPTIAVGAPIALALKAPSFPK